MADSQFFIKESASLVPEINWNMISDSRNKIYVRQPGWNMVADKYSYVFYVSDLCELSDQITIKVSQHTTNLHICTCTMKRPPLPFMPNSTQHTIQTLPM